MSTSDAGAQQVQRMNALLEKYSSDLKPLPPLSQTSSPDKYVILTGSTGALGSYILDNLIRDPSVSRIYCLNRSAIANDRQRLGNDSRGLSTDFEKVRFILSDFSRPDLCLSQDVYAEVLNSVTHIIHNAWMINIKLPISFFETTHIAGVRHLIDLSNASTHRAAIIFTSTYGTTFNYWLAGYTGKVPERVIKDPRVSDATGYCEAKWVSEVLLHRAGEICGTRSVVLRVGQIAGAVRHGDKGCWNESEHVPRLVASSKYLKLVPRRFKGVNGVDWLPIEVVADVVCETMDIAAAQPPFLTVVNEKMADWAEVIAPAVRRSIEREDGVEGVKIVEYGEWVDALRRSMERKDVVRNPAMQLLSFYERQIQQKSLEVDEKAEGNPKFETTELVKLSKALRGCGPVTGKWMEQWMGQWRRQGDKKQPVLSKLS